MDCCSSYVPIAWLQYFIFYLSATYDNKCMCTCTCHVYVYAFLGSIAWMHLATHNHLDTNHTMCIYTTTV